MLDVELPPGHNETLSGPSDFAIMEIPGFDPSTMTYLASQLVHPNASGHPDPFQDMLMPMDMPHHSQYGADTYTHAGSDDFTLHGMPGQTTSMKRTFSTYEDPFSDVVSAFENPVTQDGNDADAPSIDRDNKLLSFSIPSFDYTLLDYTFRRTSLSLSAQLHGMFFLAESPWASAGDTQPPPTELTCYRRNLFQITGEVTLPRGLRYILTEHGEQLNIIGQELVISATESTEGNPVKIISVPWKTPANPSAPGAPEDKAEREPPCIPLDLMNATDVDGELATFPFQWKRLQFRIATANNGRRKELQQHFIVQLKIVATLATGNKIPLCHVQSGAIIVRGRSPRNFQSRKDMPLNGTGHRKAVPGQLVRTTTNDSIKKVHDRSPTQATQVTPTTAKMEGVTSVPKPPPAFRESSDPPMGNDYYDWTTGKRGSNANNGALANSTSPPELVQQYTLSSPDRARHMKPFMAPPAPINLSLVEEDSPHSLTNNLTESPESRLAKKISMPARAPSFTLHAVNSPDESADLLYEYFPLGLDDWMPPVDAVYRPHVVHHTKLPSDPRDPKTSSRGSRSKRYFSEDVT